MVDMPNEDLFIFLGKIFKDPNALDGRNPDVRRATGVATGLAGPGVRSHEAVIKDVQLLNLLQTGVYVHRLTA